ncbi:MAG: X2-like carbohydrate binding domain-containing protein, partial [Acetanaerobacterium sp.]
GVIPDDGIINMSTLYSLPEWSIEGVNSIEISFGLDHFVSSLNFENIKMSNISITNANAHLPLIISQPTDKTVLVNAAVNLSVTASVSSGTLSYQWYSSNENSNTGGIPISGETLASYSAPTTAVGMMYYYCVVTNTDPDATISTTATTVTNAVAVTVNEPVDAQTPNIDTQPVEQTVVIGASTNLSVAASVSIGTLSYQWYSNDENSTTGGLSISGETLASYSVPTTATGTTYYYCAVTNTDPDATGSATASAVTNAVAITVTAAQPVISPTSASYDLNAPADVSTSITWGSADAVTGVVRNLSALTNNTDYTVSGDTLTIKDSYLSSLTLSEDDTEEFEISFDMGDPVSFIVTAVTSYIPGSDATLSDLTVGGSTVDGFEAGTNAYDVELPYGTLSGSVPATIGAVPNDSMASVSITQAVLPGDATVQVTAEDGETQQTYTVNFTLEAAPNTVPSLKSGVSATAAASTTVDTAYMLDLSTIFEDADEDPLTYTVQIDGASVQEADADYSYTPALAGITTLLFAANDGIEDSSDTYTISLTVTELPIPTYVLTITAGTGGRITAGSSGDYSPGTVINIQASSNSIYRFNKWTTSDGGAFANASSPTTTFTMPANATTIRAGFIHTGGSGRNNDDDDSSSDTYLPDERIIESSDQVSVNLIRGRTVLSADQFDTLILQNRTKPVVLTGNGYTLTFPVGSLSTARGGRDYRLGISFNSGSRYEAIKTLAGAGIVTMLDFDHSGALPGRAIVRFYAGSSYAGKTLYYYYYNPTTQAFEYRQSAVVDRGGYVTITQTYCSEYVLSSEVLTDKKPGIPETGAAHEPMTCAIPDVVPALIGKQKKRLFLDNKPENDGE